MVITSFLEFKKIFLGVQIDYPDEFLENWNTIKKNHHKTKKKFTVYQLIKLHNKIFEGKHTNVIEFGTDRGGGLTTISKFIKKTLMSFLLTVSAYMQRKLKKT